MHPLRDQQVAYAMAELTRLQRLVVGGQDPADPADHAGQAALVQRATRPLSAAGMAPAENLQGTAVRR